MDPRRDSRGGFAAVPAVARGALRMLPCIFALAAEAGAAQSRDIYKCLDDQGHTVFQDNGRGKSCERVDIFPIATVPGLRARSPAVDAHAVTPASFPRADGDAQHQRELDRRRILEDEVRLEEDRLAHLRGEFNDGKPIPVGGEDRSSAGYQERSHRLREDIERSEGNLASLKRELSPPHY
jgi:uncharacterized protein DUF4124